MEDSEGSPKLSSLQRGSKRSLKLGRNTSVTGMYRAPCGSLQFVVVWEEIEPLVSGLNCSSRFHGL